MKFNSNVNESKTKAGRIFTWFIMIAGLGIVAVPTGLFAAELSKTVKDEVNDND